MSSKVQKAAENAVMSYFLSYRMLRDNPAAATGIGLNFMPQTNKEIMLFKAKRVIAEFEPVWESLSYMEQQIMTALYDEDFEITEGKVNALSEILGVSSRTIYRLRQEAMKKINTGLEAGMTVEQKDALFKRKWC